MHRWSCEGRAQGESQGQLVQSRSSVSSGCPSPDTRRIGCGPSAPATGLPWRFPTTPTNGMGFESLEHDIARFGSIVPRQAQDTGRGERLLVDHDIFQVRLFSGRRKLEAAICTGRTDPVI